MASDKYPYSFSDDLASPDMAAEVFHYESPDDRFAREVAAEANIKPNNPAYGMVRGAILRTLEHIRALTPEEPASAPSMDEFEQEFQAEPAEPQPLSASGDPVALHTTPPGEL